MRAAASSLAVLLLITGAAAATAQVTARPATKEEAKKIEEPERPGDVPVESPMLVEVAVSPTQFTAPQLRDQKKTTWSTVETAKFVCDKARVKAVTVDRIRKKSDVELHITPTVGTKWFRQDIDLTVTLLSAAGEEIARRTWDDLTIGHDAGAMLTFGSRTKAPTLEHRMPERDFLALFDAGAKPIVRVLVEIQGEEGNNE